MHAGQPTATGSARGTVLVTALVVLVAANLRPALTALGPVIAEVQAGLGLTATEAGALTTLPLVAFAVVSPAAVLVARRAGTERTLALAMALVTAGILVRSAGPAVAAFAGTALFGAGIAAGNVLLPGLVKRELGARGGAVTGIYVTVMVGVAGVAAAVSVPLAVDADLGWRLALAAWALPAALALAALVWDARHRRRAAAAAPPTGAHARFPWRSALAWQVTAYMGLQSLIFYAMVAWLPEILRDQGLGAASAGVMLGLLQVGSLGSTMAVPRLAERRPSQRGLVTASTATCAVALAGLLAGVAELAPLWVLLLGAGTGASLSLSLTFFVLRARSARQTEALSGMAQSVGYGLAATGPAALGAAHDATGAWTIPLVGLLAVTAALGAAGLRAARDRRL